MTELQLVENPADAFDYGQQEAILALEAALSLCAARSIALFCLRDTLYAEPAYSPKVYEVDESGVFNGFVLESDVKLC